MTTHLRSSYDEMDSVCENWSAPGTPLDAMTNDLEAITCHQCLAFIADQFVDPGTSTAWWHHRDNGWHMHGDGCLMNSQHLHQDAVTDAWTLTDSYRGPEPIKATTELAAVKEAFDYLMSNL